MNKKTRLKIYDQTGMSRWVLVAALIAAGAIAMVIMNSGWLGYDREVKALIDKNVAAKGGEEAWRRVQSLRLSGRMDLGQGVTVPYSIEQKRPNNFCLRYEFDDQSSVQCVNDAAGWRFLPFLGHREPIPMTVAEQARMADTASIDGMLFNGYDRGVDIEILGTEIVDGKETRKLAVTMPGGTQRWIYLDVASGLEVKVESKRIVGAKEQLVETLYPDWIEVDGLLFPSRQLTRVVGKHEEQFVTVEQVTINPAIEDSRFEQPAWGKPNA